MATKLNRDDVHKLLSDPVPAQRADVAKKVAQDFVADQYTAEERELAEDILRLLARDASDFVRAAVAENVKFADNLPRDIALALAQDLEDIACQILEISSVLTDGDLINLISELDEPQQKAIARREHISVAVSDALVETNRREVVRTLVTNHGAEISDRTLNKVVNRFGHDQDIQKRLIERPNLPLTISEKLVARLSDELRRFIAVKHPLSTDTVTEIIVQAREKNTLDFVRHTRQRQSLEELLDQLRDNERLTPSLLLRSLFLGDIEFFERGVAKLADIPIPNAQILIYDKGKKGFESLCSKAGLPAVFFPAFEAALEASKEVTHKDADDHLVYQKRFLEVSLTKAQRLPKSDQEYLLKKLHAIRLSHQSEQNLRRVNGAADHNMVVSNDISNSAIGA